MADTYPDFETLQESESRGAFTISVRDMGTPVAVAAPHGGGIEPGTSEIAAGIAGADLSCYLFEGVKPAGNRLLHITSSNFDEPRGLALLRSASLVLTVHGEESDGEVVYLGGLDGSLAARLRAVLERHGYQVREHPNQRLRGLDPRNLCNIGLRGAGLQLELTRGLRCSFFESLSRTGRARPRPRLSEFCGLVGQFIRAEAT